MAQSNLDYIKERDKETLKDHPWLRGFNYEESVSFKALFEKIQNGNAKKALETITSNSKSKLNVEGPEKDGAPKEDIGPLKVDNIVTTGQEPNKENKEEDITK